MGIAEEIAKQRLYQEGSPQQVMGISWPPAPETNERLMPFLRQVRDLIAGPQVGPNYWDIQMPGQREFGGEPSIRGPRWNDPENLANLGMGFLGAINPVRWTGMDKGVPQIVAESKFPQVVKATVEAPEFSIPKFTQTQVRESFGETFDDAGKSYMNWVERNRNKSAVHPNAKTGLSLDYTTGCCNRAGSKGACAYCYVEQPRTKQTLGMGQPMGPKKLVDTPYKDEILNMPNSLVEELNKDGGLRHQSFSDYMPEHLEMHQKALEDASIRGLKIKTITKSPEFVKQFGDHPNQFINISVDEVPGPMSHSMSIEDAFALKADRPNIKIRSVALTEEQAARQLKDPRIDVVTMYHGDTGDKLVKIIEEQNKDLVKEVGADAIRQEAMKWQNMPSATKIYKKLAETPEGKRKLCCQGGKCAKDATKCGFGLAGLGMIISGVDLGKDSE